MSAELWWPVAIVATAAGLSGLWLLLQIGLELYTYCRTEGIGVKDPTVNIDQYREARSAYLLEMQVIQRERERERL